MDAKVPTSSQGNVGPVQPSAGKGRSATTQHSSTHMGSNRNNQAAQNKSRLSNNDPNECVDDSEGDSSDDDKLHEEPPDMRVYPEFLKNLPGVQASDSMGFRIEALRVYLETQLGDEAFIAVYQHLNNLENDEDDNMIESIVGAKKMKFVPLIHHLIVCEDNYYTNWALAKDLISDMLNNIIISLSKK